MLDRHLHKLLRKEVIVRAKGMEYRGILLEVTEDEVILKRLTGYAMIPMVDITRIQGTHSPTSQTPRPYIDPSYYTLGEENS